MIDLCAFIICLQVPTWRGDPIRQPSINQSIDCPYTSSFNFHPDATHLAGVRGFREDLGEGKEATVRN
jgi:hypothetical protein